MSKNHLDMRLAAFRAFLPDDIHFSLQKLVEQLEKKLPNHVDRTCNGATLFDKIAIAEFKKAPANRALGVVFSIFEEGAKASTLNFKESQQTLSQSKKSADSGEEFLGRNVSILVEGNHVIACNMGNRAQLLIHTLLDLAKRNGIIHSTTGARLSEVPHNPTVKDVIEHGVKSIDLNITNYLASLPPLVSENLIGRFFGHIDSVTDMELRKTMTAKLKISGKKLSYDSISKDEWLKEMAIATMNDDDVPTYKIVLGNNVEISPKSMVLSKKVEIRRDASSFDLNEAHQLMIQYLRELKENGLLT